MAPRAIATPFDYSKPYMSQDITKGKTVIKHRELLGGVNLSTAFQIQTFRLNPGLTATFPWLSIQAKSWELYRFKRLTFRYITRVGTSHGGSVILSPEYDANDEPPSNEAGASNTAGAVENTSWRDIVCTLDTKAMEMGGPMKYIRSGNVPGDLHTYDAGFFCVVTVDGLTAAPGVDIGKLWVEYEVEFSKPQTSLQQLPVATQKACFEANAPQNLVNGTPVTKSFPVTRTNPLGIKNGTVDPDAFVLPRGTYEMAYNLAFNYGKTLAGNLITRLVKDGVRQSSKILGFPAGGSPGIFSTTLSDATTITSTGVEEFSILAEPTFFAPDVMQFNGGDFDQLIFTVI